MSASVAPPNDPRYPWEMDAAQPLDAAAKANLEKAAKAIYEVTLMKQQFFKCHEFLTKNTYRLVELLSEAETRGLLLDEALTLADTSFWLQMIDWQSKFLSLVLNFTKDPNRKTLRPLIELYGRDRDRMRTEVEILERQLEHRLATFAKPDDGSVRKAVTKNQQSPRTAPSRPPRSQRQREPGRHRGAHGAGLAIAWRPVSKPSTSASRRMPMTKPHSFDDPAGRQLLAAISKIRRMTSGDPKYHSGRKKKEYASPYLEFLAKIETNARRMPQYYEFSPQDADGIRHADLDAGERILKDLIYECQRSLEGIEHARLELEAGGDRGRES
jgi:hypothetical protein